jgi:hypothetical protein
MVLGQPSETFIDYRVYPFKSLTGQRALLKNDILPILDDIREIRFGVEIFINLYFQAKGKQKKNFSFSIKLSILAKNYIT